MDNDDRPVGRFLSRRQAIALFAAAAGASLGHGVATGATTMAPDCVAQPEQTEGPFFAETALERSDLRHDPTTGGSTVGSPLALKFLLSRVTPSGACAELPGARVDIWHCDAMGVYSDVESRGARSRGEQFLRGYQVSDEGGAVRFSTIYPGWYRGRAVHIHFKVRVPADNGRIDEFTSQLYLPDELTDRVHMRRPYAAHQGQRLLNARDWIFREGGTQLVLPVLEIGDGFEATYRIALQPGVVRRTT